jgi:hypothetical protein
MPVTIGLIAAGTQALAGAGQAAFSGRKKRERELDAFAKQSPLYKGSKSVDDYYQEAMNRYKENPYQSLQYQVGQKNIQRAMATGLSGLQSRGSAIGGIGRLFGAQTDAMANLGAQTEGQRNARFGQLGSATQMKTGEEYKKFDINQMTPYNRMLQLKQYKAQAANDRYNAGVQMVGSALGNAANVGMMSASGGKGLGGKTGASTGSMNLNPYNSLATSPFEFGTNYIDYNTQSANPSAYGTNYMDFNKYKNRSYQTSPISFASLNIGAPKTYKGY